MEKFSNQQSVASSCLTPCQLAEIYIEENILSSATKRHYRFVCRLLEKDLGSLPLSEINAEIVLRWRNLILARTCATTWNNYRLNLGVLWRYAVRKNLVTDNPFTEVYRAPVLKKSKKTVSGDVIAEAIKLLKYSDKAPQPGWFWAIVVKVLYYTGMRRRQLINLKWRDLDFDQSSILLTAEGSKTRREWQIPMPQECWADLLELKRRTSSVLPESDLSDAQVFRVQLFYDRYGGAALTSDQLSGFFRRLSASMGEVISSHRLRHTMATHLAKADDASLIYLKQVLGHTDFRTTQEYVQPDQEQLRQFINQLKLPD